MIRVLVSASGAIVRAGLEALVRSNPALELAVTAADADVILAEGDDELEDTPVPAVHLTSGHSTARGVLPRDASPAQVLAAIDAVAAGLVVSHPEAAPIGPDGPEPLSPREVEVLRMLADGAPNKTIAWKLGISEHTVKFHVASIMAKLNAGSRTEAVTTGIRRGLILL